MTARPATTADLPALARVELNIWTLNDRARAVFTELGYTRFMERCGRVLEPVPAGN